MESLLVSLASGTNKLELECVMLAFLSQVVGRLHELCLVHNHAVITTTNKLWVNLKSNIFRCSSSDTSEWPELFSYCHSIQIEDYKQSFITTAIDYTSIDLSASVNAYISHFNFFQVLLTLTFAVVHPICSCMSVCGWKFHTELNCVIPRITAMIQIYKNTSNLCVQKLLSHIWCFLLNSHWECSEMPNFFPACFYTWRTIYF